MNTPKVDVLDWSFPDADFRLAAVDISAVDWVLCVPEASLERINRFSTPETRARAGASEWLKQVWMAAELDLPPGSLPWEANPHGKPLLTGALGRIGFNLSHSGDYAVAGWLENGRIGVDVEKTTKKVDAPALARRVLSDFERAQLACAGDSGFFTLWTQKEALLKALGCGWSNTALVQQTRLTAADRQIEPLTQAVVWSRPAPDHDDYMLSVAVLKN